ncbi:MAG TPA: SGNH hydrolase domain-containing protein, partial [Rhizomicrobium sp.]
PSVFIDTERILCGTAAACPVFTPGAKLVSFDGSHLTAAGAGYAGRLLFTRSALATLAHK